ncbi:MAG: hypothetical protein L0312_06750, partial [Acidobacteria bacterium]|nr:hypothetical protein [Acidobacteriota bacterium]
MPITSPNRPNYIDTASKYQFQTRASFLDTSLILLGFASIAFYLQILWLGDLRQQVPEFLCLYFVLFIIYVLATAQAGRYASHSQLRLILGFAFLFRIVLIFGEPSLSDDIHRYMWEGYLQTQRINPYQFPPEARELAPLRDELWERVNNKDASAIYPPLLQMIHAAAYFIFRSIWGFKLIFLAVEAALIWILLRLLMICGRRKAGIIFYAWNPLVVVEIAGNGHHDACVAALLFAAALYSLTLQHRKAVLAFAGSVLCKLYPLAALPFFLKKTPLRHSVWLPLILVGGYLPYASAGSRLFSALVYYREKWRFNGFLFLRLSEQLADEERVERLMMLLVAGTVAVGLARKYDLIEQLYWVTGAILICAPTLFPWYLIWMAPFLCFFSNPAWMLLTALSPLSYYVLIDWWTLGIWHQSDLFLQLQYYPFYGLLIWN